MKSSIMSALLVNAAFAFKMPSLFHKKETQSASAPLLKADDFLVMPQMMQTMGQVSKGLPIQYRAVPLVVGTKEDMDILREELRFPLELPSDVDADTPKDHIVTIPLTLDKISHPAPLISHQVETSKQTKNGSCGVSLDDLLPLLRTHPIPTIVHDNPQLVLNMLRLLVGPKPDGTKSKIEALTDMPENVQRIIVLATRNPNLVRTLAKFDPLFIPSIVNAILGIRNPNSDEADPEPDQNSDSPAPEVNVPDSNDVSPSTEPTETSDPNDDALFNNTQTSDDS